MIHALPELIALQNFVERSDWHCDNPFAQSLRLFLWIQGLPASVSALVDRGEGMLRFAPVPDPNEPFTCCASHDFLAFSGLLHDIGKASTYQVLPDGTTRCPNHEAASGAMTPAICERFGLSDPEKRFVTDLVAYHGKPYELFKQIASMPKDEQATRLSQFEAEHADHLLPLLLLATGDLVTSHLRLNRPEKYQSILDFYRRWLERLLSPEVVKQIIPGAEL